MSDSWKLPYWRLSGFYFFYFATLGGFLPYWNLYLQDIGFNAIEIGEMSAFMVGTKIVAPNIWGWIADHTGRSLRIIRMASFLAVVFFAGFLLDNSYRWFAWVTLAFSFFWNAALPQFEALTLFHLKKDSHRYSQIRLWGSIGFIATVLGIGHLLDSTEIRVLPLVILALLFLIWLISLFTPDTKAAHHEADRHSIVYILKKPEVLAFLMVYLLLQVAHGPYYVFYSIYLSEYHYSTSGTGLLWALGVSAEVILFVFMRFFLNRFTLRRILLLSLLLTACRWLIIAQAASCLWAMLVAQLLHAVSFGSAHIVAIHLVHFYFGSRHQGKGQALYSSMSFGLGAMLGSLGSGYYWEIYGGPVIFLAAALISLLGFVIAFIWVGKKQQSLGIELK